jgi:hypothetical protein
MSAAKSAGERHTPLSTPWMTQLLQPTGLVAATKTSKASAARRGDGLVDGHAGTQPDVAVRRGAELAGSAMALGLHAAPDAEFGTARGISRCVMTVCPYATACVKPA